MLALPSLGEHPRLFVAGIDAAELPAAAVLADALTSEGADPALGLGPWRVQAKAVVCDPDGPVRGVLAALCRNPHPSAPSDLLDDLADVAASALAQHRTDVQADRARWHDLVERYVHPVLLLAGWRIAYANAAALRIYGVTDLEDLIGVSVTKLIAPEQHGVLAERFAAMRKGVLMEPFVYRVVRPDGALGYAEVTTTPLIYGDVPGALVLLRDVTDAYTQAQRDHFHATLLDTVGQAVVATDVHGTVTYWNHAAERLFGYPATEILGCDVFEVTASAPLRQKAALIFETLRAGDTWQGEFGVQHRDGTCFTMRLTLTPLLDGTGRITSVVSVAEDVSVLRRSEEALAASEIGLGAVLDHMPLIFFVIDTEGRFLLSRGSGLRALGLADDQVVGQSAFDLNAAKPEALAALRRSLDGEQQVQLLSKTDDGLWYRSWYHPIFDGSGQVTRVVGIAMNVTEEHVANALVRRQRSLLAQTQDHLGMWAYDVGQDALWWSEAVFRIHGLPVGSPPDTEQAIRYYEPSSQAIIEAAFTACVQDGAPFDLELELATPQGKRWVQAIGSPIRVAGAIVEVSGTFLDITQRKMADLALRRSRIRLEEAQRIAQVGSWTRAVGSDEIEASVEMRRIFGIPPSAPVTIDRLLRAIHPDDRSKALADRDALDRGEGQVTTYRIVRPDGTTRVLKRMAETEFDATGSPTWVHGTVRDVTQQIARETELDEARKKAEAMNQLKDTFLTNLSHEIRTPLTVIRGYSDILLDIVPEAERDLVHLLRDGGNRLFDTFTTLLEFASLESGTREIHPSAFDARATVARVVRAHQVTAQEKGLALALDAPTSSVLVLTDQTALHMVTHHLVSNAVKFTPEGHVVVQLHADARTLTITVEDTGIGIAEPDQARIFESFRQASTGSSRGYEGIGLGLSVSRELVTMLGGTLALNSCEGKGATFTAVFPRRHALASPSADRA